MCVTGHTGAEEEINGPQETALPRPQARKRELRSAAHRARRALMSVGLTLGACSTGRSSDIRRRLSSKVKKRCDLHSDKMELVMNRLSVGELVCLRPAPLRAKVTCDRSCFIRQEGWCCGRWWYQHELFSTLWRRASGSERALGLLDARPQHWNAPQVASRANHEVAPRLPPSNHPQSTKESVSQATGSAKTPRIAPHDDKRVPSLNLLEADKKRAWVQKLQVFAQRAGASAGLFTRAQELIDDRDAIVTAVLSS